VMGWQAVHASDARLRRTLARVAADEARHAALAWAVACWADERLDAAASARVRAARARAARSLTRGIRTVRQPFVAHVGLPGPAERSALLAGMIDAFGL